MFAFPGDPEGHWTVARLDLEQARCWWICRGGHNGHRSCRRLGRQARGPASAQNRLVQADAAQHLRGFVSVEFGSGLRPNDCPVHCHANGRTWIALSGKPQLDENGQQKRDGTGKLAYVLVAEWRDRATSDRFSEIVAALLRERYPGALDRGGAPLPPSSFLPADPPFRF